MRTCFEPGRLPTLAVACLINRGTIDHNEMFFQATRPGASTVGLGVLLLLSLTYILTTSWPGYRVTTPHSPVRSTPLEPGSLLYPQVVVTGDSIAERSFENGPGYGSTLVSMVRMIAV